jgi:N-acetylglucosaminyl-diphospho-decaprenol L-rhamnosyltransferase
VSGACFLARRDALEELGGFDEGYFMFAEDMDLCWRAGRAGWRIGFEPAALVTHQEGVSRRSHPYRMALAHHRSALRFAAKTTSGPRRLLLPLAALGLGARLLATWATLAVRSPAPALPERPAEAARS